MKNDQDLFSIGEIAKALGVTRRIILHYEERGLIRPDGRDGATGNRYYTIDTFTQLRSIRSLQNLGLSLDEIRDYFQGSADLTPLIRRLEKMRDELNLNIEKLYERSKVTPAQVKAIALPPQRVYRRVYRSQSVAERTALLRATALEAMRSHGTDTTRRMYFVEYPIADPARPPSAWPCRRRARGSLWRPCPPSRPCASFTTGPMRSCPPWAAACWTTPTPGG